MIWGWEGLQSLRGLMHDCKIVVYKEGRKGQDLLPVCLYTTGMLAPHTSQKFLGLHSAI